MRFGFSSRKKFYLGLFVVLAAYAIFTRLLDGVAVKAINSALKGSVPIIVGFVIAFLLNPILNRMEKSRAFRIFSGLKKRKKIVRATSIITLFLVVFSVVGLCVAFLAPSIYDNTKELIRQAPAYFEKAGAWIEKQPWLNNESVNEWISQAEGSLADTLQQNAQEYLMLAGRFIYGTGIFLYNSVMAFLVAYFLLYEKEMFAAWFSKLWRAVINNDIVYSRSVGFMKDANRVFSSYIVGRLIESLIMSVIALVVFAALGIKYSFLIAFVVGLTNLIPYIGPFLGAVIAVLVIMFENPDKIVFVLIFLFVLQQIDSFVITPLVLGDRLKVNALWIIIGIILGGSMFGMIGMILGAPLAAITVDVIEHFVEWRQSQRINLNNENTEEVK